MTGRYLLDTHALLWALGRPEALSPPARGVISIPDNVLFVSVASLWECAIKSSLGKLDLPDEFFSAIPDAGYDTLDIELSHLKAYRLLPMHHRDPFDRMLVAQAKSAGLTLLTRDAEIMRYDIQFVAC